MQVNKAIITAAGKDQRTLPLQTLYDRNGVEKSVLNILMDEVTAAGIQEICVVIRPGDEETYRQVAGPHGSRLVFVTQDEPLGHGHAVYCAKAFTENEPFLHLVGDHIYVNHSDQHAAKALIDLAVKEDCAVSAVQATRESMLPLYGAVGGKRVQGRTDLYEIDSVVEKPTPTQAELQLIVPGLRSGRYLCFFGMHVLTPMVMDLLGDKLEAKQGKNDPTGLTLSAALSDLCKHEKYLAVEREDTRYDVGVKYGLLTAQVAMALHGKDREEILTTLLSLLAERELERHGEGA